MSFLKCKSCERMDELEDNSIDLIVTSPPYWNAIDYDQHILDKTKNYRTRRGDEYAVYLDWLKGCFKECYRVLKPGRFCCVVIGTVLYNGRHYPLPQHFITLMEEINYEFHQDIIWYKVTGGVKRAGVTIQSPYPGYYCPNIMTEYILIFRKPGQKIFEGRSLEEKERNKISIDSLFTKELANNIWHIAPVPPNQYEHPCPFPEEIPYRLIKLFSYEKDRVLDPFVGIGTTCKVARCLGREYYGYDIKEKYIQIAKQRIFEPLKLRRQLICKFEKLDIHPDLQTYFPFIEKEKVSKIKEPVSRYVSLDLSESIDFSKVSKSSPWLIKKGQKMVISTDFDGLLSGIFLGWYLNWEVVGFYDSESLYLRKEIDPKNYQSLVFVDIDINRREARSIGHHVLKWSKEINIPEQQDLNSFNPNLLVGISFKERWQQKYPFATIHLLLAFYYSLDKRKIHPNSEMYIPILLHVDSTFKNSVNYHDNTLDWIDRLGGSETEKDPLYPICKELNRKSLSRVYLSMSKFYKRMKDIGYEGIWKKGTQKVIEDLFSPKEWDRLKDLNRFLSQETNWSYDLPILISNLKAYQGKRYSKKPTKKEFLKMIKLNPFSYAFISQAEGGLNYTVFDQI